MKYEFSHVHVLCTDLEPVVTFFTEAFGAEVVRRRMIGAAATAKPGADVKVGDCMLYLKAMGSDWKSPDPTDSICGYNHIAFLVDDVKASLKELTARKDTRMVLEPYVAGSRLCAFVAGPDNLYVEVMEDIK